MCFIERELCKYVHFLSPPVCAYTEDLANYYVSFRALSADDVRARNPLGQEGGQTRSWPSPQAECSPLQYNPMLLYAGGGSSSSVLSFATYAHIALIPMAWTLVNAQPGSSRALSPVKHISGMLRSIRAPLCVLRAATSQS